MKHWICLLLLLLTVLPADASHRHVRGRAIHGAFMLEHPCPSTGRSYGACPGYTADHVWPLCAGGVDAVNNLAWEQTMESVRKDAEERALCTQMQRGSIKTGSKDDLCRISRRYQWVLLEHAICIHNKNE